MQAGRLDLHLHDDVVIMTLRATFPLQGRTHEKNKGVRVLAPLLN